MKTGAGACLLAGMAASAPAAEVLEAEVRHNDGRYSVRFAVQLAAPRERVQHLLTDYENYASYFRTVKESRVLGRTPDGALRVRLLLRSCVLFFCREATQVKDITEHPDGRLEARIDPKHSDFRETVEHWRVEGDAKETRLSYRAALEPTFYVPPLIGPWLLRNNIARALERGAQRIEKRANE